MLWRCYILLHDCQSSLFFSIGTNTYLLKLSKNHAISHWSSCPGDAMAMASPAFCLRLPRHQRNHRRHRDDGDEGTAATAAAMDGRSLGAKAKYHRASGAKVKDVPKSKCEQWKKNPQLHPWSLTWSKSPCEIKWWEDICLSFWNGKIYSVAILSIHGVFAVYRGWDATQLCGDYFINNEIRIPEHEPTSISWNVVLNVAQVTSRRNQSSQQLG